ncbi:CAP family protein [Nocardia sp. NBC_00403]|uniref:CAP family protein n=1 Tax=Nocardia sp. NBC_00403 TaxID=2975990 RepID=UPI002E1EB843
MRFGRFLSLGVAALMATAVSGVGAATAQPSATCGGVSFAEDMLNAHNQRRAKHQSPPLVLDPTVTSTAQRWADKLLKKRELAHSVGTGYGENLFYMMGDQVTGFGVTKAWYDEIKDYDFNNPGYSQTTGHFTQVVWKNSQRLGVGIACDGTRSYAVANYDPAGNMGGVSSSDTSQHYRENVGRPS